MHHFKCPKCKKITPASDDTSEKDAACPDCGAKLILLAPVKGAAAKSGESDDPTRKRGRSGDSDSREDDEARPKSKKKRLERDEDEDEELKPRPKKRASSRSDGDGEEDQDWYRSKGSTSEGSDVLGPCQIVFTPSTPVLRMAAMLFCTLALAGVLSCVLSWVVNLPDGTFLFTIAAVLVGLGGLLWCMNYLTLKVSVHSGGLVHSHRGKAQVIPWEDISSVTEEITEARPGSGRIGAKYVYTLKLKDFSQFIYTNRFKDIAMLGNIILEKTNVVLLPQARLRYDRGEMVDFGRLAVSKRGLHQGKNVLVWEEIQGVKVLEGHISVNKQGAWTRWSKVSASSMPNLHVFLTLVGEVVSAREG